MKPVNESHGSPLPFQALSPGGKTAMEKSYDATLQKLREVV